MPVKNKYNICPKCGGKKWYTSELCRRCQPPPNKGKGWSTNIDGRKVICKVCGRRSNSKPFESCPEGHHKSYRDFKEAVKRRQEKDRIALLKAYGGKCECCGFSDLYKKVRGVSFLQMDHINGGGRQHWIKAGRKNLTRWLYHMITIEHKIPKGFRVLCISCNMAMEPNEKKCEYHKWQEKEEKKAGKP